MLAIHSTGIYEVPAVLGIRAKSHCSGVGAWLRTTSQWLNRQSHYDLGLGSLEFFHPSEENRHSHTGGMNRDLETGELGACHRVLLRACSGELV